MATKYFKEKQKLKKPLLQGLLGILALYTTYLLVVELYSYGVMHIASVILLSFAVIFTVSAFWIAYKLKLKTTITNKGIKYKLSPLHRSKHKISWDDVDRFKIIETPNMSSMQEFSMRYWFEKKITISGRNGLAITTNDGDHYFIGSQDVEALKSATNKAVGQISENK
ncbi:MAG: hypothetical protein GVX78_04610 [Bacteroidetes bacterium]|jgi:hypothetical protein|nr:hypothetical protein [Bacteroidota bacterium]